MSIDPPYFTTTNHLSLLQYPVTICLEGLADMAAAHEHGGKQSITYHLYIFGAINSNFWKLDPLNRGLRPVTGEWVKVITWGR